ncbi:cytochrome P450 [Xylaria palmicola]|nr:cytochrome P450 [Xylaria palmicola]
MVCFAIYNAFFHPLARYPGPWLARSTLIWRIWQATRGHFHTAVDEAHKKYGPVVRVSPNELSFASASSVKDIYGHPTEPSQARIKGGFYDLVRVTKSTCITSEKNPEKHKRMKQLLSTAFSPKALREQESVVAKQVDEFVDRLVKEGGPGSGGLNLTMWFEMVSFDILGDMAFGESFGCVENGKPHFWSQIIMDSLKYIAWVDSLRHFPLLPTIIRSLAPLLASVKNKHTSYTRDAVTRRLEKETTRKDFMSDIARKVHSGDVDKEEMIAHASTLVQVLAGAETIATFFAGATYFLLKPENSAIWDKLCQEVRGRYSSYEEINSVSAQKLPYLQAVISESLRIYPPAAHGFPRRSPGTHIDGHWVPEGVEMFTSPYTITHDAKYFPEPYQFQPERWLDPASKSVKAASQPFSLGPRGCVGQNFAMMEINQILAKMVFRYDWRLMNPDLDWLGESLTYVLWSKPAMYVEFKE